MLQKITYPLTPTSFSIDLDALNNQFNRVCVFDSNSQSNDKTFINCPKLIAIDCVQELIIKHGDDALNQLQRFIDASKGWLFGYLSYDLKNEIENLYSENEDGVQFPLLHFFSPLLILEINQENGWVHFDDLYISKTKVESILESISKPVVSPGKISTVSVQSKITKQQYLTAVSALQQHIRKGDIYEVNFCQEFYATQAVIQPVQVYKKLNSISEAPFAAYCNFGDHQLICSSPERFLQKHNKHLISQPIKGTIRRSADPKEDDSLKKE